MRAAGRAARDRYELHRLHSKRVIDVRAAPSVGGPPFGVNLSRGAPAIAAPAPIEDHLDVVLAGEPCPYVVVEAWMITGNDQEVPDRAPAR
jgi:hypothetical protein